MAVTSQAGSFQFALIDIDRLCAPELLLVRCTFLKCGYWPVQKKVCYVWHCRPPFIAQKKSGYGLKFRNVHAATSVIFGLKPHLRFRQHQDPSRADTCPVGWGFGTAGLTHGAQVGSSAPVAGSRTETVSIMPLSSWNRLWQCRTNSPVKSTCLLAITTIVPGKKVVSSVSSVGPPSK